MGRFPTWIVVGAVTLLVAVAAADALRPDSVSEPRETPPAQDTAPLRGVLVAAAPDCSVRAVRLDDRLEQPVTRPIDCDGAVWSADGTLSASCARNVTTVSGGQTGLVFRFDGCSPAWRPDGAVSFIDDGDVVVARRRGRPQVFLSRVELVKSLAGQLGRPQEYRLVEVAWRDTQSFAGVLEGRRPWQRALVYHTPDATSMILRGDVSSVRVSPRGNVAFAHTVRGAREFGLVDPAGEEVALPSIRNAQAIAWSADEEWVAIATSASTFIARAGSRHVARRIPIGGESLQWLEPER